MVGAIKGNAESIRQAMEQVANKPLEQLDQSEKASALQTVAKEMGVKPAALLNDLESMFPTVFGSAPQGLDALGAGAKYQGAAGGRVASLAGAQIQAMTRGAIALEGVDPDMITKFNLKGMLNPGEIGAIASRTFEGRDNAIATAGYSAPPDGTKYAEHTEQFLGALADKLGTDNAGFITSPTADKGSIDAITTMLGQAKDLPVLSITAKDYVKYINPDNFPEGIDKGAYAKEPKHVFADAAQYNQATAEGSNAFIATGGRDTTCFDFMRAIEKGNPVVLVDDKSMQAAMGDKAIWDGDKGRVNNGAAFLAEQLAAFAETGKMTRDPVSKEGFGTLDTAWLEEHADTIKKNVVVVSFDGADGIGAAANKASSHLQRFNGAFGHTDAKSVREEFAPKFRDIMRDDGANTAAQLNAATSHIDVSDRVRGDAGRLLQRAGTEITSHIKDGGFDGLDGQVQAQTKQHAGYISGELQRKFGLPREETRAILEPFYMETLSGADGDRREALGQKLAALTGGSQEVVDFVKSDSNGWMFNQWEFGDVDKMMNQAGLSAGAAVKDLARSMTNSDAEAAQLLDAALNRTDDELAQALANPQTAEDFVTQFAARAAQVTWKAAKTGVGITEANNPKKEDRVPGKFAPGNDLITDFDHMAESKGWPEVAKDIDQIRTYLLQSGFDDS